MVDSDPRTEVFTNVPERNNCLKEEIEDIEIELEYLIDQDAKVGMTIQGASMLFLANMKCIMKLTKEKSKDIR